MTPEYEHALAKTREAVNYHQDNTRLRVEHVAAVLKRLDDVEEALADTRNITCSWCGHKTQGEGRSIEDLNAEIHKHVLACPQRPERKLAEALYSISITLGLELWEDFPKGDMDATLEAVEKAMNGRELAAFLRGLRAGNVAAGKDADELPVDSSTGIFAVIDRAMEEFIKEIGPRCVAEEVVSYIKAALQKASAEELELREIRPTRNSETLTSFAEYCRSNPEQRFWQALRNWSGERAILVCDQIDLCTLPHGFRDTFQREGRSGNSSTGFGGKP